jgi:hypothetical protein
LQGLTGRVTESSTLSGMGNTVFLPQDLTGLVGQASLMRGLLAMV